MVRWTNPVRLSRGNIALALATSAAYSFRAKVANGDGAMSLTKEELAAIEQAKQAVAALTDQLAEAMPDRVERLSQAVAAEDWGAAQRLAQDIREVAGTTGWEPLAESAKHFVLIVRAAPADRAGEMLQPVLDGMIKIARAEDRSFSDDTLVLLREMSALSSYARQLQKEASGGES